MTIATPEEQDAALAALTGNVSERRPEDELQRNLLRLRLVMDARNKGIPWAVIGQALGGISGKAAKSQMKHLAARTQRELLAGQNPAKRAPRRPVPRRRYVTVPDESTVFTARRD